MGNQRIRIGRDGTIHRGETTSVPQVSGNSSRTRRSRPTWIVASSITAGVVVFLLLVALVSYYNWLGPLWGQPTRAQLSGLNWMDGRILCRSRSGWELLQFPCRVQDLSARGIAVEPYAVQSEPSYQTYYWDTPRGGRVYVLVRDSQVLQIECASGDLITENPSQSITRDTPVPDVQEVYRANNCDPGFDTLYVESTENYTLCTGVKSPGRETDSVETLCVFECGAAQGTCVGGFQRREQIVR